jgi:hypothetical protein
MDDLPVPPDTEKNCERCGGHGRVEGERTCRDHHGDARTRVPHTHAATVECPACSPVPPDTQEDDFAGRVGRASCAYNGKQAFDDMLPDERTREHAYMLQALTAAGVPELLRNTALLRKWCAEAGIAQQDTEAALSAARQERDGRLAGFDANREAVARNPFEDDALGGAYISGFKDGAAVSALTVSRDREGRLERTRLIDGAARLRAANFLGEPLMSVQGPREALQSLVALKDMHDLNPQVDYTDLEAEAWQAARAALSDPAEEEKS